jgi:SSS family solute:Na+ symporter
MAASGNVLADVLIKHKAKNSLLLSQSLTFNIGLLAIFLAVKMTSALDLMLHSYSYVVSGMIIPVLAALFFKNPDSKAALFAKISGGATTLTLVLGNYNLPLELDANIFSIAVSLMAYFFTTSISKKENKLNQLIFPKRLRFIRKSN